MQFRVQGKKLQCIRSTYDPASKRSHQKLIATLPRWADSFSSGDLPELSDIERDELAAYIAQKTAQDGQALILKATLEDGDLAKLAKAVSAGGLSRERAVALWELLDDIGNSLEKIGHPKPSTPAAI